MIKRILLVLFCLICFRGVFAQEEIEIATPNLITEGIPKVPRELIVDLYNSLKRTQSSFITFKKDGSVIGYNDSYNPFILNVNNVKSDYQIDLSAPEDIALQPIHERSFIYTADAGGDENKQLFLYDFESRNTIQLTNDPSIKTVNSYIWSKDGDTIYFISADRKNSSANLYSVNFQNQETTKLATLKADTNYLSDSNKDFLVFYRYISNNQTEYYLFNLGTKEINQITKETAFFKQARFSKVNNHLYFLSDKEGKFYNLYYFNLKSKTTLKVNTEDLNISSYKLSPDEKKVAFKINEAGAEFLRIFQLEGDQIIREISKPDVQPGVIERFDWKNDEELGFTFESLKNPPQIKNYNIKTGELKTIASGQGNQVLIQNLKDTKILKWKSFDNREISGLMSRPASTRPGEKMPVLIDIHGGPKLQYQPFYSVFKTYSTAKLNAVTIFPNIRGSSGFGREFENLDNLDKREDAIKDIEALIAWIKTQPDLDSERIILKGDSYGGFVAIATAIRNPHLIRAVIAERPTLSLRNTTNYSPQSIKEMLSFEYGPPNNNVLMEKLEKLSVLHKDNLNDWKLPLFLSIGQNDVRVPVADVENLKNQLKAKGVPVWFMKAKNEGHFWREFENNVFLNVAEIAFLRVQGGF